MRKAEMADIPELTALYTAGVHYAGKVGMTDWQNPFPIDTLQGWVDKAELFCEDSTGNINAAIRLIDYPNPKIWDTTSEPEPFLYGGKLVTSNSVHGTGYTRDIVIPFMYEYAHSMNMNFQAIRGDCLANNPRLISFYSSIGFVSVGDVTFYSAIQSREISVRKLQLNITV